MKALIQACILALALSANAQGFVEAIPEYNSPASGGDDGTIGFTFRANADLTVMELGVFSYIFDSVGPINVGVWNDSGALLSSTTVSNLSPLANLTRYELLPSPLSLQANQIYFIGAYIPSVTGINLAGTGIGGSYVISPWIEYLGYARVDSTSLTKPVAITGGEGVVPATANFRIVPEPGSLAFILLGGMALIASRRGRK